MDRQSVSRFKIHYQKSLIFPLRNIVFINKIFLIGRNLASITYFFKLVILICIEEI